MAKQIMAKNEQSYADKKNGSTKLKVNYIILKTIFRNTKDTEMMRTIEIN